MGEIYLLVDIISIWMNGRQDAVLHHRLLIFKEVNQFELQYLSSQSNTVTNRLHLFKSKAAKKHNTFCIRCIVIKNELSVVGSNHWPQD
jgi:hypothetical protein